ATHAYPQPAWQWPQIRMARAAPDGFPHFHQTEDRPPLQCFFLRLRSVASLARNSWVSRSCAPPAHSRIVLLPNLRISSTNNSSTSSAVLEPPASRAISKMLCTRAIISGRWRNRSINSRSSWLNSFRSDVFFFILTLFTELDKKVHLFHHASPTSNHTRQAALRFSDLELSTSCHKLIFLCTVFITAETNFIAKAWPLIRWRRNMARRSTSIHKAR